MILFHGMALNAFLPPKCVNPISFIVSLVWLNTTFSLYACIAGNTEER